MRTILFIVFLFFATGATAGDGNGRVFTKKLLALIDQADRIVVIEHSDQNDAIDFNAEESLIRSEIVYGQLALSRGQVDLLRKTVSKFRAEPSGWSPACVIEVHHTIKFYLKENLISTMDICFHCRQIRWDRDNSTPSERMFKALGGFITAIGYAPVRDWRAMAMARLGQ